MYFEIRDLYETLYTSTFLCSFIDVCLHAYISDIIFTENNYYYNNALTYLMIILSPDASQVCSFCFQIRALHSNNTILVKTWLIMIMHINPRNGIIIRTLHS